MAMMGKPGGPTVVPLALAKGCLPPEMAASMLPVTPHVVTMTSSSR